MRVNTILAMTQERVVNLWVPNTSNSFSEYGILRTYNRGNQYKNGHITNAREHTCEVQYWRTRTICSTSEYLVPATFLNFDSRWANSWTEKRKMSCYQREYESTYVESTHPVKQNIPGCARPNMCHIRYINAPNASWSAKINPKNFTLSHALTVSTTFSELSNRTVLHVIQKRKKDKFQKV